MDVNEKLISAVYEKRPLWDMKSKLYHSRDVQRKLWMKVGEELGINDSKYFTCCIFSTEMYTMNIQLYINIFTYLVIV